MSFIHLKSLSYNEITERKENRHNYIYLTYSFPCSLNSFITYPNTPERVAKSRIVLFY